MHHHTDMHPGELDLPQNICDPPEVKELKRRWPIARNELAALLHRVRDIRRANPESLHAEISSVEKSLLRKGIMHALIKEEPKGLKRSVARRMADKIGDYLLWRRETTVPVIHELIVLLPWWISHLPGETINRLRDIGLNYILNGRVLPIQEVWQDILTASPVYIGHCACRSAGIVDDLKKDGKVFNMLSEKDSSRLLDRFMARYESLRRRYGKLPDTDAKYTELFKRLRLLRKNGAEEYRIETLLEATYPDWEILPVTGKYTPTWIRSMHKNNKAHLLHKELAFEFANIQYLARGTIFSSMKLFDTPYTICSCPSPELGGGCTLTNWYYYGMSNASLLPNEDFHGRRRDETGQGLPCRFFPVRSQRECLGCGCDHELENPRDLDHVLAKADAAYRKYIEG
ncbi:MAG: hypothetical protein ACLFRF_02080 [Desulfobacterales bacterium]